MPCAMRHELDDLKKIEKKKVKKERADLENQLFIVNDEYMDECKPKRKSI